MAHYSRPLSKSKLIAYRQCHKRLWLEVWHPERKVESESTLQGFQVGHNVGEVARRIYDPEGLGVLVDVSSEGFESAFQRSIALLQAPAAGIRQPIFEAGCKAGGGLAFADVMLPLEDDTQGQWRMVEVKASTQVKPYHRDDMAIQSFVFRQAGVPLSGVALAHIDNSWIYPGKEDYRGLLTEVDFTEEVFSREDEVRHWITDAQRIVVMDCEPDVPIGTHCREPYACGFEDYCKKELPKAKVPIHWLPRIGKKLSQLIQDEGLTEMADAPDELLSAKQLTVKNCTLRNEVHVDRDGALQLMKQWSYPLFFLDFETIGPGVPHWPGTRPYQQVPFQYSLHRLSEENVLFHSGYLAEGDEMPARALAAQLIHDCGTDGSIVTYNAGFERGCLDRLAAWCPDQASALRAMAERLVDLLTVTREYYYHPAQHGSWSLKQVLPALVPDLNYAELDEVQDGGMAQTAYAELLHPDTENARRVTIRQQLLAYCHLDTLAMVEIRKALSSSPGQATDSDTQ
jgi:hypothetical protein